MAKFPRPSCVSPEKSPSHALGRRALLIFADQLSTDLAKRRMPWSSNPLFSLANKDLARSSGAELHLFTSGPVSRHGFTVHRQIGDFFAERFENAVDSLAKLGFDQIVAIGRDCPQLEASDVEVAFTELATKRLVLGPDHRGGCYLIGVRAVDRQLLRGIRWKQNTDRAELVRRCGSAQVRLLPVKYDLDSWADVRLLARTGDRAGLFALWRFPFIAVTKRAARGTFVDLSYRAERARRQMPPPALRFA